jgi:hypothetical protein
MMTPEKRCIQAMFPLIHDRIFTGWSIVDTTLLPYARNDIIDSIYEHDDTFTHILFVDDDMSEFNHNHVLKLLHDDKPIVSALVCKRAPPYHLVVEFKENTMSAIADHIKARRVVESEIVGMAFTLIKREVLDATREETPNGPIWFTMDRGEREGFQKEKEEFLDTNSKNMNGITELYYRMKLEEAISFGQTSHIGARMSGEDAAFCMKAKALGFPCYVDCGVSVSHIGTNEYDFRYSMMANAQSREDKPELQVITP